MDQSSDGESGSQSFTSRFSSTYRGWRAALVAIAGVTMVWSNVTWAQPAGGSSIPIAVLRVVGIVFGLLLVALGVLGLTAKWRAMR